MSITREDIKKFMDYCDDNLLTDMFLRDSQGKIIKDREWYRWLLVECGYYLGGDIYDVDLCNRYNTADMCWLFGEDRVRNYCDRRGWDFLDMLNGFGCIANRYDGVKFRIDRLNEMYNVLLYETRNGAKLNIALMNVSFDKDIMDLTFVCKFINGFPEPSGGVTTGYVRFSVDKNFNVAYVDKIKEASIVRKAIRNGYLDTRFGKQVLGLDSIGKIEWCIFKLLGSFKVRGLNGNVVEIDLF